MSDEQWLRERLADAVPDPPAAPDRARAAERRARQRRRTTVLAAAGAAATVAAVAVLTTTLDRGDETGPSSDPTASDSAAAVPACPSARARGGVVQESPIDRPDPEAPDAVPEGAASARLCQGPGTVFDVPDDALVTDVDALVEAVNGLEQTGEPEVCTMDLGPGYRIAFGYDDGSQFVVSGQLYGCRTVVVGSGYRADSQPPWDTFVELLRAQRDAAEPPDVAAEPPTCPGDAVGPTSPVAQPSEITEALLCVHDGRGERSIEIPADDLAVLVEDMRTSTVASDPRACLGLRMIVAATSWGERLVLPELCTTYEIDSGVLWSPTDPATRILDRLAREAR